MLALLTGWGVGKGELKILNDLQTKKKKFSPEEREVFKVFNTLFEIPDMGQEFTNEIFHNSGVFGEFYKFRKKKVVVRKLLALFNKRKMD